MKVFKENGLRAKGQILPYESFKLFRDYEKVEFNDRKLTQVVKSAEKMLESSIPQLPASLYREFFVNGDRARFEGEYFKRRHMAIALALAEAYDKKGRFTEKLMDAVWAITEESTWIIPAHLYNSPMNKTATLSPSYTPENLHGIDLFSAATGAALTLVLYYAKDALDKVEPIICKKIEYMLRDRLIIPFLQCSFWWTGETGRRVNNWCPWICSNILLTTAIVEKDLDVREQVVEKAMEALDRFTDGYAPDGGCDEGPSYWNAAGAALFDCLELLEDMSGGKINVYSVPLIKNIGEYICKMNVNQNNFINFADCNPKLVFDPAMLTRFGTKLNSDILVSFGKMMAGIRDDPMNQNICYRTMKGMCFPDVTPETYVPAKKVWFPDLKVMVVRECDKSDTGMLLAAKGGNNDEMHNHNDVGNFTVYKDGKPVIIDTGVGTYTKQTFSPQRYELWFMQSGYHNLPSFGGIDQKNGGKFRSTEEVFDENSTSLSLQLKNAYPEEAGVISFVREMCLSGGTVKICDRVKLNEKKNIDFHFMSATQPTLKEKGAIALAEGCVMKFDPRFECEIEAFEPTGMNTKSSWDTDTLYRIHLKTVAKECTLTVSIE